jgi:hypothetical protein
VGSPQASGPCCSGTAAQWCQAVSTVHQILLRNGLVGVQPRRCNRAWKRFERPVPNDLWQIDATKVRLADTSKAWVIDVIDDHRPIWHRRARLPVSDHHRGLAGH